MLGTIGVIIMEGGAPPTAPSILGTARIDGNTGEFIVATGSYTRLRIYYPDLAGTLVWDSDDPGTAGDISQTVDGRDIIRFAMPASITANRSGVFQATDTVGGSESLPTDFTIPARKGGGMLGGGALVGFGGM